MEQLQVTHILSKVDNDKENYELCEHQPRFYRPVGEIAWSSWRFDSLFAHYDDNKHWKITPININLENE